jgi:hypothetical protein
MKRRRFLASLLGSLHAARARVGAFVALLQVGGEVLARSRPGNARAIERMDDAETDWLARSTGPGVLWAHDFRQDNEFHLFHKGNSGTTYGPDHQYVKTNPTPMPYHATLVVTPFGGSRAIRSRARGTVLTQIVPRAATNEIQTWHVADASEILDPWNGEYRLNVAAAEIVWVQSVDRANNTVTVRRTDTRGYPVGTRLGCGPQGRWIRPMACFPAGQNGKSTDDQGITNGSARRTRSWDTKPNTNAHVDFREGYFGHRSYWDPKAGPARYKDWQGRTDAFEGDEFWLQFRAKISASRFAPNNPGAKMIYVQSCAVSQNAQLFWGVGAVDQFSRVPANWRYGDNNGALLLPMTCWGNNAIGPFGSSLTMPQGCDPNWNKFRWADGDVETIWQQHPDDNPKATYNPSSNYCIGWHLPADRWVTYLLHMKLGRSSVEPYAVGRLRQAGVARVFSDKAIETLHLDDVSGFPDVTGAGNYEYHVMSMRASAAPNVVEHMRVVGIDRRANTLTVQRNVSRGGTASEAYGLDRDAKVVYGPGQVRDDPKSNPWFSYGCKGDPRLGFRETTVELFVAVEGETKYTKITSWDRYAWIFGDSKEEWINHRYNPPGLNSIELSQYINDYMGAGAVSPPGSSHWIDYTQAIFSREFIPVPRV